MSSEKKRKIAVVTTSRAEYGLLYWLLKEIHNDTDLILQFFVGGAHLSSEFGKTVEQIQRDEFDITEQVEFLLSSDSGVGVGKGMGLATLSFVDSFARCRPDIVVLLGDRWETLAIALAATSLSIPIAHIHGGEVTYGAMDDSIRHAVTKLSHIHFPASKRYAQRISQMGENPQAVFPFGAPGLDHIHNTKRLSRLELEAQLKTSLSGSVFLCTFHPVTNLDYNGASELVALLKALSVFPDVTIIFTRSNADENGRLFNQMLEEFISKKSDNRFLFSSLGLEIYLSLAEIADVVVGNSSSGLIEVPLVKTPTVNVGVRQQGRECASSVINCDANSDVIVTCINKALSSEFKINMLPVKSPYSSGEVSLKIKEKLKSLNLNDILIKQFVDSETYHEAHLHYC